MNDAELTHAQEQSTFYGQAVSGMIHWLMSSRGVGLAPMRRSLERLALHTGLSLAEVRTVVCRAADREVAAQESDRKALVSILSVSPPPRPEELDWR